MNPRIVRYQIGPYGARTTVDGVDAHDANVIPDAGILFEIHVPLYGIVGTFFVKPSTDERHITDGGLDVRFYYEDKWYFRLIRLIWPFRGKDIEEEEAEPETPRARRGPR